MLSSIVEVSLEPSLLVRLTADPPLLVVLTANAILVFLITGVAAVLTSPAAANVVMLTAKTALAISLNFTISP